MIYLPPRFCPQFRLRWLVLAILFLSGQAPQATAQTIVFPQENLSDLRGLLNVFHAFRRACLEQPASRDLPARLVPEGYKVVTGAAHWGWEEGSVAGDTAILSKTGLEQGDWDGGHPFVTFSMPSDAMPEGRCSVVWKRAWDYEDGREKLALGMFGVFDAQVSYALRAILNSKPDDLLSPERAVFAGTSDWYTWCWDGNLCTFKIIYTFDPGTGIDISISREAIMR